MTDQNLEQNQYKAKSRPRPLSPHLQVYKPQITSITSISHRASGVFLYLGSFILVFFLATIAFFPEYDCLQKTWASIVGKGFAFLWTLALYYHLCNGIRHLFWDFGYGYSLEAAYRSAYIVFGSTIVLTAITWLVAFKVI